MIETIEGKVTNGKINTEELLNQLEIIKSSKMKLSDLLQKINVKTNELKECWESDTSESVYNSFDQFYNYYKIELENLEHDIKFLETTISNYMNYEKQANKDINEKIDM